MIKKYLKTNKSEFNMKKLALLLSLTTIGSIFCASNEFETLKEKHALALKEVQPHINDMWYETQTTQSNNINYSAGNGLGVGTTQHTSNRLVFNTQAAGRTFNVYKKALSALLWKVYKTDLKKNLAIGAGSLASGALAGVITKNSNLAIPAAFAAAIALPVVEVIRSNLTKDETKYLDENRLEVYDNLFSNINVIHYQELYLVVIGDAITK